MNTLIAIDIDNTWSVDPLGWGDFMFRMVGRGHNFIFATGRKGFSEDMERMKLRKMGKYSVQFNGLYTDPEDKNLSYNRWLPIPIVYCGNESKRQACLKAGYEVDIWIDDMPAMIDGGLLIGEDEEL